jgi:L,D-transpeptidase YcbB
VVNVPSFHLTAYDDGQPTLAMKVVTGKLDSPTPVFNGEMTTVVFSPYWNVPPTIAADEIIPAVLRDPGYLRRHNMEVVRGTQVVGYAALRGGAAQIRQRPGTGNALGLVKFLFPNPFNVYLHDTPADSLFDRATRSFSHGCVRVAEPLALAEYVLRDQPEWDRARIEAAMHAGEEKHVKLKSAIPVYLGYWTARVRPDGTVQFRKDVYGIDRQLTVKLADRLDRLRRTSAAATAATTVKEPEKKNEKKKTSKSKNRS